MLINKNGQIRYIQIIIGLNEKKINKISTVTRKLIDENIFLIFPISSGSFWKGFMIVSKLPSASTFYLIPQRFRQKV